MFIKKCLLVSGVAVMTATMLTGCGKVNVKIYDKEKESEFKVNNVVNEVAVNEVTNEVANKTTDENKQVQNTVKNENINNSDKKSNDEKNEIVMPEEPAPVTESEFSGQVITIDTSTKTPSMATVNFAAYISNSPEHELKGMTVYVQYNGREPVGMQIDKVNITNEDVAAGTTYCNFSFEGNKENGEIVTGSGLLTYSNVTNINGLNRVGLELKFDQDVYEGINISTNKKIYLDRGNIFINKQ